MKAQCERCKEIVALDFTVADGGIEVRCAACSASYFVAQAATQPAPAPASALAPAPAGFQCPKCAERQPEGTSCRRCGLVYDKWKGHEASVAAPMPTAAEALAAGELFAACEAHWGEPERHDRFLAFCQQTGALGYAAARYRGVLLTRANDPVAAELLVRIRTLAEATLARGAAPIGVAVAPGPAYGRLKLVMLGIVVLLAVGTLWAIFFRPPTVADEDKRGASPTAPTIPRSKLPAPDARTKQ